MKNGLLFISSILLSVFGSCNITKNPETKVEIQQSVVDTLKEEVLSKVFIPCDTVILQKNLSMSTSCGDIKYHRYLVSPDYYDCILVLYLHGGCSVHAGDPLELEHGNKKIVNFLKERKQAAIVLFPEYTWSSGNWSQVFVGLKELIDAHLGLNARNGFEAEALVTQLLGGEYTMQVSVDRIYVTGTSDGGEGAYGMIAKYPNLFNSAMPVAAGWRTPLNGSRMMVVVDNNHYNQTTAEQVATKSKVKYECQGENHGACCQQAYTDDRMSWFFNLSSDPE